MKVSFIKYKFFLYSIIVFIIFSCGKRSIDEVEPNNSRAQSQTVTFPLYLKGSIENYDKDVFKFINLEENYNIQIELETDDINLLKLSLFHQDNMIKSVSLSEGEITNRENLLIIKNVYLEKGIYLIQIEQKGNNPEKTPYLLSLIKNIHEEDEEMEPNDRMDHANLIDMEKGYIKGYFSPGFESPDTGPECDWFRFSVSEASNLLSFELTGVPGIDPVIELYNELGIMIKRIDSFGWDEPEILKNFGLVTTGEYYFKIYSKSRGQKNNSIPYQFYIRLDRFNPEFEFEPNDSLNKANPLIDSIKGYINPAGDTDWFSFSIEENRSLLNLTVTPLSDVDLLIKIYNSIGEIFFQLNSGEKNESEIFPDLYIEKGKYFLSLADATGGSQNINSPYTVTIRSLPFPDDLEKEPNNSLSQATPFALNSSVKGFLAPQKDLDYFKFSLNGSENLKVSVSPVPALDLIIEIVNTRGEVIASINKNKTSEGESDLVQLEAGNYYVILKDAENKSNYYEKYILTILER
ncbi:MAG: hypothetical protein JW827_04780 [Spirochaetes bacterium]|nr:hypothetical protein [Spirochaetota bacterium]